MPTSSHMRQRVVILGGGYAGLTVAERLGKQETGAAITLIDAKPAFQERIRLHQVAAGQTIRTFQYRSFLGPLGGEFIQAQVTALDPAAAVLTIEDSGGTITTVAYDYLVYALGSSMDVDAVAGVREHGHAFQSVEAASGLHRVLSRSENAQVLVVGGGLSGIETVAELADSMPHLRLTLAIDKPLCDEAVPGGYARTATNYLYQALEQRKITLRSGARVTRLQAGVAALSTGQEIAFDACIWTSGFVPPTLAGDAGIEINRHGQIITDAFLRSLSHPNIIAIGDAAQAGSTDGGGCRMGCATALAMATAGARTLTALLASKAPPAFRFVYLFRNISLGRRDGVVQFVDRRDVPRNIVWTGVNAAAWKEYICLSTLATVGLSTPERPPALPPLRMLRQLLRGARQYA